MPKLQLLALLITGCVLNGCASEAAYQVQAGEKMKVRQHVMDFYNQKYLPKIGSTNDAAFAVSQSGDNAGFSWCPDIRCQSGATVGQEALHECNSDGDKCYIFAVGSAIKVDYEVVP